MTPEQKARYESAVADAHTVYAQKMMEANAIQIIARSPVKPIARPSLWSRIRTACRLAPKE